ncbi:MAG: hypothetical protein O9322_02260 [Beijerinckiaceae bacterium]|nr:hypothetical protein [Beijerinckiaceae bacterium]MCZ8301385.1 hypothetical protein [Beijerinckiaceae bacterium]
MATAFFTFLGFLGGFALGMAISVGTYIIATSYFGVFDRDGGGAMAAIFGLGPMLGCLLGLIAAIVVFLRRRRRAKAIAGMQ